MSLFEDYDYNDYQKQVTRQLKLFKNSKMGKCLFNFQKNIEKYPSLVRFFKLNTITSYSFEGNQPYSCLLGKLITKTFNIKWEFYLSKFEGKNPDYDKLDNKIIDTLNNLTDDNYRELETYIKSRNPFIDDYYDIYKDFEKFFTFVLFRGKEQ
jgi:hypothetical protein